MNFLFLIKKEDFINVFGVLERVSPI